MTKQKAQTLKGFRDFLPEEMATRNKVINTLKNVFESFGFLPLETPTLEYASVLLNKYGKEADKLVYTFKDKGNRKVGLRYDLTVPISRVLATCQDKIKLPFKRYQIQNVFRADKPQRGRYREFTQCDIDTFGVNSPLADAEIILVIYKSLQALGFKKFKININSRQVLFKILKEAEITNPQSQLSVIQSIDKLDKKGKKEIIKELENKKISSKKIAQIFKAIKNTKPNKNLEIIFDYLENNQVKKEFYVFNPVLARGLDYYTGPIFETYITEPKLGSVTGGGRYNKLIQQLGGPDIPATGTTIGLGRIVEIIKDHNLWPDLKLTKTKVLVTIFSKKLQNKSIKIFNDLQNKNINTELYLDPKTDLRDQIGYANSKSIPYVIIIGPDEVKNNKITFKNMQSGQQETLSLQKAVTKLKT